MPNFFAYFMLAAWPIIAIIIYRKNRPELALLLIFLVPYLMLPARTYIDFPLIPQLDKMNIPGLMAFFIFYFGQKKIIFFPEGRLIKLLIVALILSPILTGLANKDALFYGPIVLPGLKAIDILEILFNTLTQVLIPFILGCQFLRSDNSHKSIITVLATAGLIYSIPILWEIRMSPQLHTQIYGFFPHNFGQQMRGGGFRAVVMLGHGLLVAIFLAMSIVCIATLMRDKIKIFNLNTTVLLGFMLFVLAISKSLGATLLCLVVLPLVIFTKPKFQITLSAIALIMVTIYPVIRDNDIFDADRIGPLVEQYNPERAQSLTFRLTNEEMLLEKAYERSIFGWGSWGRNRIYDSYTGKDISITDGEWIIIFSALGWLGYLTKFLLISWPAICLRSRYKNALPNKAISQYTATLLMILTINTLDSVPNSSINAITYLVAGAILGRSLEIKSKISNIVHKDAFPKSIS